MKTIKKETREHIDLEPKIAKLTDFVPQHAILILDQNQSPSSEVDTNTTLITSNQNVMTLESGSSSACLTSDLIFPANSLDTFTANVDASCFIIHSGVEIIAENESLVGHGDGGEIIQSGKDEVNIAKDPWL